MARAGNAGTTQAADKAQAKAKKLKRKPSTTPVPPNFPKKVPVRPGAVTNRYSSKPSTQAQRSHVHKERIKRNKQLAPEKAFKSQGQAVEKVANQQKLVPKIKGKGAQKYVREHPELFSTDKKELKAAGFTPDIGVKLTTNAFKDLLDIGQTPVSVYHQAEPIVKDLAKGDFKGAGKETLKQGKAIGDQYVQIAKHPVKSFKEHPVFTPLAFAGVEGAVGRTAGAVARKGALGGAVKKAASTERVTKTVPGTSLKETTKHSPDVIRKGGQVLRERYKGAKAHRIEAMGGEVQVPKDRMSEREIARRVDERIAVNEDIRRQNRENAIHETHKALKGSEHPATSLIAQGIVKADRADISNYIKELEAEHPNLKPAQKHANRNLRRELQKVVDNPKVDLAKAKVAGENYAKVIAPRSEALIEHGMLTREQSDRAVLMSHATRYMDAKHDGDALVTSEGKPLSTGAILKDYNKQHGLPPDSTKLPAFVTHRERSKGSFNVRSERAPSMGAGVRTGRSVKAGLLDSSHDALVENAARIQGLRDAAEGFTGLVDEFSVKQGGKVQQFGSRKEALNAARDMRFDEHGDPLAGGHNMVPIRLKPFNGTKEQLDSLVERTRGDEFYGSHSPVRDAIESAMKGHEGEGPWALVPEAAAKRIQSHLNTMGGTTFEQAFQAGSGHFRKTVLSTSPTWLWGNVAEAGLRSTISGAGPLSYRRGQRVLREIARTDPELAQIIAHRVAGGGHFSTAMRQQVFRSAEQFAGTAVEPVAKAGAAIARAPGARNIANGWHAYSSHVFKFNSTLERHFQTAMFGKALKREGYKAIEDAVKGLQGTESQVRLGRMVDDMYGKYSKWSPSTRHMIATYTPFISWWMAAANFTFRVLPRDHPVATSLFATSNLATEKWRKENKITLAQLGIKNGFLAGSVPGKGGTHTNIARFTPFGAFTSPTDVVHTVLPQLSTFIAAGSGEDWKGHEYKNVKEGVTSFGNEIAGAYIPGFQRAQSARKYGAAKSVNPYRPIAPGKQRGKPKEFDFKGESSGQFDWSGDSSGSGSFDWGG